ncbi:magnesium-translocating P-type ATPase [Candidatus Peregrinibacteria bacterium]|nr:magnesium-translocating P-type ATPase [Candidatus Peregrinibacteria bacterium]
MIGKKRENNGNHVSGGTLEAFSPVEAAKAEVASVLADLRSSKGGLSHAEANHRLSEYGLNEIASEKKVGWPVRLFSNFKDPLSLLLLALGVLSWFTGETKTTGMIIFMLLMSVLLRFVQETRADASAEKLKAMVRTVASVLRGGIAKDEPLKNLVPGDVVHLAAGDMVPADVRLIESNDLFVNQATLTGEAMPAEKHAAALPNAKGVVFEFQNLCFMGSNVESGTAVGVVVATGKRTQLGKLAKSLEGARVLTSFDKGVGRFTWLMIRMIAVMTPVVFLINGFRTGDWLGAFLFALAVAVGLAPEMLPMIVTVNLSRGAYDMSQKKVIVKRLNSIQNFGAMDVLCTDKTGTLTEGRVVLIRHLDIEGKENEKILDFAYLNSYYQTGLKNLLDVAVLKHETEVTRSFSQNYKKVDEIPFDFIRRRMSVVVEDPAGKHLLICKGAVEEVVSKCTHVLIGGKAVTIDQYHHSHKDELADKMNREGFRIVAVAFRHEPLAKKAYSVADEKGMTLMGFLAFLDPPKPSAGQALAELAEYGIRVKVLTGDSGLVAQKICGDLGLKVGRVLSGEEIEGMGDAQLEKVVEEATILSKLEPHHKERVIRALQANGHAVGFLGDGINDAPALKAADVGISVDTAADIAKESSDIILLEKSLTVLKDGVREGRKVFGNIVKYIKMGASSNFGNMFSVVGGSLFLPFLPMLPIQVIANNVLYDFSQITIPTDTVDEEYIKRPRKWDIGMIEKFIFVLGPISSLFDFATYFAMLYLFGAWTNPELFHTGWFVESLVTQTLIIHVIRTNKIPFIQSRASWPITLSTFLVVAFGAWLPFSPLAPMLGFTGLPPLYWAVLILFVVVYFGITQWVKWWFVRRYQWE